MCISHSSSGLFSKKNYSRMDFRTVADAYRPPQMPAVGDAEWAAHPTRWAHVARDGCIVDQSKDRDGSVILRRPPRCPDRVRTRPRTVIFDCICPKILGSERHGRVDWIRAKARFELSMLLVRTKTAGQKGAFAHDDYRM